jgi:hypothetical protein
MPSYNWALSTNVQNLSRKLGHYFPYRNRSRNKQTMQLIPGAGTPI